MPISIGGQTYTDQQIQDFYKGGGNERQFLQQSGVSDPWQARDLTLQARQSAGYTPTMQDNFKQYQQASPNGAYANNYNGWLNDMKNGNPTAYSAMQSGTYTGAPNTATDWAPGGIYEGRQFSFGQSGQGQLGIGDGWGGSDGSGGGGGGGGNLGFGGGGGYGSSISSGSSTNGYALNPYLDEMAKGITEQVTDNYNRNIAPQNRSGAMAVGGMGGSRQGVVEANALNDMNRGLGANLANLYGQGWQNQQTNSLQSKSIDNSYDLGRRSNDLGYANLDSNNAQFGANLGLNTANAQMNWANSGVNAANAMQNTPTQYQTMFNQNQNQIAGQGGTNTSTQNLQGNQYLGAMGGWQLANQWLK